MKYLILVIFALGAVRCETVPTASDLADHFERIPPGTGFAQIRDIFGRPNAYTPVSGKGDKVQRMVVTYQWREHACTLGLENEVTVGRPMCTFDRRMRERLDDEDRAATANAWAGFGNALSNSSQQMQQRQINCTSEKDFNGVVHTNCH